MSDDRHSWRLRATAWFDQLHLHEEQLNFVLSIAIGAMVGTVVVAFILLTGRIAAHIYPAGGAGWRRVVAPVLGALVSGYLIYRYFPGARGSGVPQTKAAMVIDDGRISFKTVIGKFSCCSISLASGIALGREGPSVQIGAGLASVLARRLRLSKEQVKAMVPVGGAAALAAAFNTPIAAVLFTLEETVGDLHAPVLGWVVVSSATSWMVLHLFLGDDPLFHVAPYHLVNPVEFIAYAFLGVVGGLGSVAFVKLLLGMRRKLLALPDAPRWWHPVIGGLAVGLMGYFVPSVLGVGYDTVGAALNGNLLLKTVVLLAVLKLVATAVCYASGNAGGIFGPTLFFGAMFGATVGHLAHAIAPNHTAEAGAYALVGMGTAFAGVIRTPMTSVFMIFELTRDYTIIVPVMISNMIAYFISSRLQPEPIYEALGRQDGIHLPTSASRPQPGRLVAASAMRQPMIRLAPQETVAAALERVADHPLDAWPLMDGEQLRGMIYREALDLAAQRGETGTPVGTLLRVASPEHAEEQEEYPHVHPDHGLAFVLQRMGEQQLSVLPVVSRANVRQLLGIVTLDDVLKAYGLEPSPEHHPTP